MIFMEGVIFITDEIITDILNIDLKDLEDFLSYSKDGEYSMVAEPPNP